MPLSSMGGIASTALSNLQRSSEGLVHPLDAIEARRAARAAEAQEKQKADAATQKAQAAETAAQASQQQAQESRAAGEAKRAAMAQTQGILSDMPQINVENMQDPAFTQQLRGQVQHLMNSGDAGAMDVANDIMTQLKTFSETGELAEGTMQGQRASADIEAKKSQTELNRSMTRADIPGANKADMEWAQAWIHGNDPGRSGGFLSNLFTKNYTPEQRIQKGAELASILDQVKREHAAASGGQQMGVAQAQNEAISRFKAMEGETGDQPQPQPQQQPQQPQQQQGATPQPGGKLKFDWSK